MITVINYGQSGTEELLSALSSITKDLNFTSNESEIIKAQKVILWSQDDPALLIKRLHIYNLFSLLRICKNPFLGIGLGMSVMGVKFSTNNISSLGIVDTDTVVLDEPINGPLKVSYDPSNKLFDKIKQDTEFVFDTKYIIPYNNQFATSKTTHNNIEIASTVQKGTFCGVQFSPEKSGEAGLTLLKNWIEYY